MTIIYITIAVVLIVLLTGYYWRHYSLACPANLAWLVENPYVNAIAGPQKIFQRIGLIEGMKVLDVGSGPVRLSIPAAEIVGSSGEVVALDIQKKMLDKLASKISRLNLRNIRVIHSGAGDGKVDQNYFDRILLVTVLGEIPDKQKALMEMYESLKAGGILSVTELIPDPHYNSRNSVRKLCTNTGLKESGSFGNWFAYTINFTK